MVSDKERFEALVTEVRQHTPGFEIRFKDQNKIQKMIGWAVSRFNRHYSAGYTTTLSPHVYFSSRQALESDYANSFSILAHEFVHLYDQRRKSFYLQYAWPQCLGLFSLLGFVGFANPWFFLCFLFAAFFWRWPSTFRTALELRGYTMSMAVLYWSTGKIPYPRVNSIKAQFTGPAYYWMCPDETEITAKLDAAKTVVMTGDVLIGPDAFPYRVVYDLMKSLGFVRQEQAGAQKP